MNIAQKIPNWQDLPLGNLMTTRNLKPSFQTLEVMLKISGVQGMACVYIGTD